MYEPVWEYAENFFEEISKEGVGRLEDRVDGAVVTIRVLGEVVAGSQQVVLSKPPRVGVAWKCIQRIL